jgi:hypothetical protein
MTTNHGLFIVNPVLSGSKNELFNNFRDWRKVTEILERFSGGFAPAEYLLRNQGCMQAYHNALANHGNDATYPL